MRFDAVAFDLDGTLYPSYRIYALAFPQMLAKARSLDAFNRTAEEAASLGLRSRPTRRRPRRRGFRTGERHGISRDRFPRGPG